MEDLKAYVQVLLKEELECLEVEIKNRNKKEILKSLKNDHSAI